MNLLMQKDNIMAARAYVSSLVRRFTIAHGDNADTKNDKKILKEIGDKIYRTKPEDLNFEDIQQQLKIIREKYAG